MHLSPNTKMGWLWRSKKVSEALKIQLFESLVLSSVVWDFEGWLLTEAIQRKLNGWCSRCMAVITRRTLEEEASSRTQKMCLPAVIRYRRMVWLGHLLRSDPGDLTRQAVLRFAELMQRGVVQVDGSMGISQLALRDRILFPCRYAAFCSELRL